MTARVRATLVVLGSLLAGCAGTERARESPAGGDRGGGLLPPVVVPPERAPAVTGDTGLQLDAFAAAVVAAWRRDPAPIAILPAFSDDPLHPRGTQVFATGAGDWLAARVLAELQQAAPGIEAWAPETVVVQLARSNRSLRDVRATEDAVALLERTDAGYLVFGRIATDTIGGRISGDAVVRVRLACARLGTGEAVATREHTIVAPAAVRDLGSRAERSSAILVGKRAPAFEPSLDLEMVLCTERALSRMLQTHRAELAGKRCAVLVETAGADAGRRLLGSVRGALRARLPGALAGRDAITVVEGENLAEVVVSASFERGADRYTLALTARRSGARDAVVVRVPIETRFLSELQRILP